MKPGADLAHARIQTVIETLEIGQELFWLPTRLVFPSPWAGHLSTAFWLVKSVQPKMFVELGTHSGNSYSAFCQAIAESGLAARAYAVDTWKGDAHSGAYEEEVFDDLRLFNEQHYGSFSTLLRMEFDQARAHFADGSIDLLHIDGLHTYEAVKHDFETWRDALSNRAVVVFHDTNVRESDFGVWRLWAEMVDRYPSFEFDHSHGLGILGFGDDQPEALRHLFQLGQDPALKAVVTRLFADRGSVFEAQLRAVELETETKRNRLEVESDRGEIETLRGEIETLRERLAAAGEVIRQRDQTVTRLEQELQQGRTAAAAARASLVSLYEGSTSWRVTAPIRAASVALRSARARVNRAVLRLRGVHANGPANSGTAVLSPAGVWSEDGKMAMRAYLSSRLQAFLATSGVLRMPSSQAPDVTIILILHNQAELTFGCLTSIVECLYGSELSVDVVILDNNSTADAARELLTRISGATIIRSQENLHFLRGANRAAAESKGRYLLFLNNDAQLLAGSLEAAVRTLQADARIGGVGGRIILPDGTLQEAGSIVWKDGSCSAYGRGGRPTAAEFMFKRDVDYCSGTFLLTPRAIFEQFGGFDERYAPAYYEEVDYCVRLWRSGLRIVFDPDVCVLHYEFGTASFGPAMELQQRNRQVFQEQHVEWLKDKFDHSSTNILAARTVDAEATRVLVIEDRVPHSELGTGYPRTRLLLRDLIAEGARVSFYPTLGPLESWPDVRHSLDQSIEVMVNGSRAGLRQFLEARKGYYDGIIVCRPHNMRAFLAATGKGRRLIDGAVILYDGEAIFTGRERLKSQVNGTPMSSDDVSRLFADEIRLAGSADAVISVSETDRRLFQDSGIRRTLVLGHAIDVEPPTTPFETREGFLFVGAIQSDDSPNADSLRWFAEHVLPLLRRELGEHVVPTVVGLNRAPSIEKLDGTAYRLVGMVDDLNPWFARARVFVAPTRYAAGIPIKVYQAAAFGVPIVATELIAGLAGWQAERDLLAASGPADFAKACARVYRDEHLWHALRAAALERCREDCSPRKFREGVKQVLGAMSSTRRRQR